MKAARKMKLRANPKRSEKVTEAMGILKKDIKKEKDDDSPTIVATVVKRGRGRPPLNKSSSDKSPVPGTSSSQGKGRGPGRPSKSLSLDKSPIKEEPIEVDQNVDSEEEEEEEESTDVTTGDDDVILDMDTSDSTAAVEAAKTVDDDDVDDDDAIIAVTTTADKPSTSKDDEEVEVATENSDEQPDVGEDETFDTVEPAESSTASVDPQQKKPETKTRKTKGDDDDDDYVPTPTPAKRGRPPSLKTADSSMKNLAEKRKSSLIDKDKDKDDRSFERFYQQTKDSCVVSERWSFGGVLWDPTRKTKVMAASEVDVASSGNIRLKRCIQVYEDMSVKVFIEGADMTRTFSSGVVKNPTEVAQLIHKVATAKICSGIKNFGTTDKIYFPHCVLRGETHYAPECPVVIDYGVVGPLCSHCNRLRNTIHRRNVKETNLLISKFNRPQVKNVKSKFAKLLYSVLTDLVEASSIDAQRERKKLRRMIPSDAKEYPFQSDSSADGMEGSHRQMQRFQYIKSDSGSNISISTTSASEYIRLGKSYGDQNDMMTINVMSGSGHKTAYKVRGSDQNYSNVAGTSGSLSQNEMQVVEQFVLGGHDVGNVIFQNSSGDFTLAEGQEYELIGEADPNNPIQVLEVLKDEADSNNAIEIIEVDDQTLAQLTNQNMSNIIIQEPSSFEVQEIDVNDPNFRHLVKAFNPSTVVYQS